MGAGLEEESTVDIVVDDEGIPVAPAVVAAVAAVLVAAGIVDGAVVDFAGMVAFALEAMTTAVVARTRRSVVVDLHGGVCCFGGQSFRYHIKSL